MEKLLTFILNGLTGKDKFEIKETPEEGHDIISVKIPTSDMGLVIGKGGNTIKAIQTLLRVKARLENRFINLNIEEAVAES